MRRGATVIETLTVLAILAVGLRFALHAGQQRVLRGEASQIVAAGRALQDAATRAADEGGLDSLQGAPLGEVPTGLAAYLPAQVSLRTQEYEVGWSHWILGDTLDPLIAGDALGTVTVRIADPALQNAFLELAHPSLWYRVDDCFTFLVPQA